MGVIHVIALDFVTVGHAPAAFFILHDVGKGDMPAGVVGDEIGDLAAGSPGCGCGCLEDEETIVWAETDAEGEEGDADRGCFGGAAEGFDDQPFTIGARRVELPHPGVGVERQVAAEDHLIKGGETDGIVGKGGWLHLFPPLSNPLPGPPP